MTTKIQSTPVCIGLIIILGLMIYGNALGNPFIWDDYGLILRNELITSFSNIPALFSTNILGTEEANSFYRPLQMLSYMLDYFIWKLTPFGFHLTNILLHMGSAILIFFLINELFSNRLLSLAAALSFLSHPVHTETVVYAASRADLLCALFILASLLCYCKYLENKTGASLIAVYAFFILALLSKEYALIMPALLILCHWIKERRVVIVKVLPTLLIAALYIISRWGVEVSGAVKTTFIQRIPGSFLAFYEYIRLLIFPIDLHMGYGLTIFPFLNIKVFIGLALLIGSMAGLWYFRKKSPLLLFALAWYLICIIPVLNIYPMNAILAEHWLYLPSIGFFLVLGIPFERLGRRSEKFALVCLSLLIGVYSVLTIKQNTVWREPAAFYQRIINYNPSFVQAYNNLGSVYAREGKFVQARLYFKKALQMKPAHIEALSNLAKIESSANNREEAIRLIKKAAQIVPNDQSIALQLANLLSESGDSDGASSIYQEMALLDPTNSEALNNQGLLMYKEGKINEAKGYYQRAIDANAQNKEALNNLANILVEQNQFEQAQDLYMKALAVDPAYAQALNNLGYLHYKINEKVLAEQYYQRALSLDPKFIDANNNLGLLYFERGEDAKARRHYGVTLDQDPNNLDALNVLGVIYGKKGDFKQAEAMFVRALEIDPGYISAIQNLSKVKSLNKQ